MNNHFLCSAIVVFTYFSIFKGNIIIDNSLPKSCPNIISRTRWGARTPSEIDYMIIPSENVVIHHTVTGGCFTEHECSSLLTLIQNFHMDQLGFHDIGYNFLIGGDGQIYEGVGWHKIGGHTKGFNSRAIGIAFIGNFTSELPNEKQMTAAKMFLQCGVDLEELDPRYKLFGARQVSATESPGLKLYQELQKWEHFTKFPK